MVHSSPNLLWIASLWISSLLLYLVPWQPTESPPVWINDCMWQWITPTAHQSSNLVTSPKLATITSILLWLCFSVSSRGLPAGHPRPGFVGGHWDRSVFIGCKYPWTLLDATMVNPNNVYSIGRCEWKTEREISVLISRVTLLVYSRCFIVVVETESAAKLTETKTLFFVCLIQFGIIEVSSSTRGHTCVNN